MKHFIKENRVTLARLCLSLCFIIAAVITESHSTLVSLIFFLVAYASAACTIVFSALRDLFRDFRVSEKMLMTVASLGAIAIKEYFEASLIVILFVIGELIEDNAVDKSRKNVNALKSIRPESARLREGGLIPVDRVTVGDVIEVLAGERIPLDGIIVESIGYVDSSVITGESEPYEVRNGAEVLSGYLNLRNVVYVKVTRGHMQSAAQRIIDLSVSALDKKTKNERFIRKFANIYTPIVILAALLLAIIPPFFDNFDYVPWAYRACALMAISCPCALVISVPLAYFCSIGYASKRGILVKNSAVMESLERINTAAFDKTGTLTKSRVHVNVVEAIGDYSKIDILRLVCIAEKKSNHPIAQAVAREAKRFNIKVDDGTNYIEIAGKGVECDSPLGHIRAGSYSFVDATSGLGAGTVFVALNGEYIGYVGIGDELKETSKIAFDRLRKLGVNKKIILSGDKKSKVDMVAKTLGADGAYSNLLPEDKLDAIEDIYASTPECVLAYCGDGINDLPSLARADVGIAMGAVGSDAAVEKSDVVIMDDDVAKIPLAIKIARRTKKVVFENIVFAIAAKAAILTLSAFGFVPLYGAVLGDVGILLLAIINSLRAGR